MFPILFVPILLLACSGGKAPSPTDADADGWDASVDCDDTNPDVHPNADERCDGVDDNCDGTVDENPIDASIWYPDGDGDGFGSDEGSVVACESPGGSVATGGDCDDVDPGVHPGADESDCADPKDYNCDGSAGGEDLDGDGTVACEDCNDADPAVNLRRSPKPAPGLLT